MAKPETDAQSVSSSLYDVEVNDPESVLVDRSKLTPEEIGHIGELMAALGRLRDAEQLLADASQRYMKLGKTDMRALHFLIVALNREAVVTPSALAAHLGISTASTTKLLDRLEAGDHITRAPHPTDRRALAITITDETHESAMQTVGRMQSKRFHAAARLSPQERTVVIDFINDMTDQITLRDEVWTS